MPDDADYSGRMAPGSRGVPRISPPRDVQQAKTGMILTVLLLAALCYAVLSLSLIHI